MARRNFTTLYNPANGLPWDCPNGAVDTFLAKGWTKNPNKNTSKDDRKPEPSVVSHV